MKSVRRLVPLVLAFVLFPLTSAAQLSVQTKDMDGGPIGNNWRRIGVLITNLGSEIDISSLTVRYTIDEISADDLVAETWYYVAHSLDWSIQGGTTEEVAISFKEANDYVDVTLNFAERVLPSGGQAEVQFGVHYFDWGMMDENGDPSYIQDTQYIENSDVSVVSSDFPILDSGSCESYYCQSVYVEELYISLNEHIELGTTGDEDSLLCTPFSEGRLRIRTTDHGADMLYSAALRSISEGMPVNISMVWSENECFVETMEITK